MFRVYSDIVVFVCLILLDICLVLILFLEVEIGGVRDEEECDKDISEIKGEDDLELSVSVDVVVDDGGKEGIEFIGGS